MVSLYLLGSLSASHVFCLSQPQSLMDHYPLCVPWCIWWQHPNPSVFNASPFTLLTQTRELVFCSLQPRVPRIQNPAAPESNFWHDAVCFASWAVEFLERTENGSARFTQFLLYCSSSRKWKWQFHLWVLQNETKKRKRKWNLTKSHKKKLSSYYQKNSWVLESGSSLFSFQ